MFNYFVYNIFCFKVQMRFSMVLYGVRVRGYRILTFIEDWKVNKIITTRLEKSIR